MCFVKERAGEQTVTQEEHKTRMVQIHSGVENVALGTESAAVP